MWAYLKKSAPLNIKCFYYMYAKEIHFSSFFYCLSVWSTVQDDGVCVLMLKCDKHLGIRRATTKNFTPCCEAHEQYDEQHAACLHAQKSRIWQLSPPTALWLLRSESLNEKVDLAPLWLQLDCQFTFVNWLMIWIFRQAATKNDQNVVWWKIALHFSKTAKMEERLFVGFTNWHWLICTVTETAAPFFHPRDPF